MSAPPIGRRKTLLGAAGAAFGAMGLAAGESDGETSRQPTSASTRASSQPRPGDCDHVVPDDFDTIQDAVDAADEGETVCVRPGTYPESVSIDTADLTLESAESREATIDATGKDTGVRFAADGVTLEGFEIVGDDGTTSGVSLVTSDGATSDLVVRDNHIHGMQQAGGGGVFAVSCWGIISWGDTPMSGVLIAENRIEDIGGVGDGTTNLASIASLDPSGVGIGLEEVEGGRRREGAVIRHNTLRNIEDGRLTIPGNEIDFPGVGIAVQPLDGDSSGAEAAATDVHRNEIEETWIDVVLGDVAHTRVFNNDT